MASKKEKKWGKKSEKRGEERKRKVNVKTAGKILLSAHARTSQANILHLDQKAVRCKPVCGKFYLFIAGQWPENHSSTLKTLFSAKSPGVNGLKYSGTESTNVVAVLTVVAVVTVVTVVTIETDVTVATVFDDVTVVTVVAVVTVVTVAPF